MMVGDPKNHDTKFEMENYEEFYAHHNFEPIPEQLCTTVNEVIPRFGWAFDKVDDLEAKTVLDLGCLDGSFFFLSGNNSVVSSRALILPKTGLVLRKTGQPSLASKLTSTKDLWKTGLKLL